MPPILNIWELGDPVELDICFYLKSGHREDASLFFKPADLACADYAVWNLGKMYSSIALMISMAAPTQRPAA